MEYTTVLTDDEVKLLRKLTAMAAQSIPPDEFSDWVVDELGPENMNSFYYTFMCPENKP